MNYLGDIVCIKVGINEKSNYSKHYRIYHDLDIVEVLPRKRDANGELLDRTMGSAGDKHFLGLRVDMSHLDDSTFSKFRYFLRTWLGEETTDNNQRGQKYKIYDIVSKTDKSKTKMKLIKRRKYKVDLDKQNFMGTDTKNKIKKEKDKKEYKAKKDTMDMTTINRFDLVITFKQFTDMVVSKKDGSVLTDFIPNEFKETA